MDVAPDERCRPAPNTGYRTLTPCDVSGPYRGPMMSKTGHMELALCRLASRWMCMVLARMWRRMPRAIDSMADP
jgi:hypothetical protein